MQMHGALEVDENFSFRFCCESEDCSLACCHGHAIALNPYEVLRIKEHLGVSSEELEERYLLSHYDRSLPLLMLPRDPCPFLKQRRCSIYEARPLACRLFPFGMLCNGKLKTVFMEDACCSGIGRGRRFTLAEYIEEQRAGEYIRMWKRWVSFVEEVGKAELTCIKQVFLKVLLYNFDFLPKGARASSQEQQFIIRLKLAEGLLNSESE